MTTTAQVYYAYPSLLLSGTSYNWTTGSYSVLLATSSYIPAPATDALVSDVSTYEATGTNYTRKAITVTGIAADSTSGLKAKANASTITWSALTASFRYAVACSAPPNGLISYADFGGVRTFTADTFAMTFTGGLLAITVPSVSVG